MCGGGGGDGGASVALMAQMMKEKQNQPDPIALERERAAIAREEEQYRQEQAAIQREQDLEKWTGRVDSAYNQARNYGQQRLSDLGMIDDPYGIMSAYEAELGSARSMIPELAGDPYAYLGPQVFDQVYNRKRDTQRSALNRGLNEFAGANVGEKYFADTDDDMILESILNQQYGDALQVLERQNARGQLRGGAFEKALADLGTAKAGAMTKLQDIGGGVLSKYREDLGSRATQLRDRVNQYDFGDNFDLGQERTGFESFANSLKGRLGGDINNAIGDLKLFDLPTIQAKARTSQGMTNTSIPGGLYDMFNEEMSKRQQTNQQGSF